MAFPTNTSRRGLADLWAHVRDLQRQVALLRSTRPVRLASGTASGATGTGGRFTVTHNLGRVPVHTWAAVPDSADLTACYVSATSTTATFLLVDRATGAATSTAYTVRWSAIA